jgi:hypothetical protein
MNPRPTLASSDQEIVDFVSSWIDRLITDGYETAIALLDDPIEDNRRKWTKEEWDRELECYGVYRYNDGSGFAVDYDLSVNGRRSDHTLQFDFRAIGSGMHVALDDLHVL